MTALTLAGCCHKVQESPMKVIFDTDMGNDIDDALALDMLYKYVDEGKVELLGITSNKEEPQSVEYIDILNTFYGHPDIPIGKIRHGAPCDRVNSFTSQIAADADYKRSVKDYDSPPESVSLMRELLAGQPDGSVTIIAVGFSTNLQRLLESGPDTFSDADGETLVRNKVAKLCMMAGEFEQEGGKSPEYNIRIDHNAAEEVFRRWPGTIVTSPFEVGLEICYPVESILNDFGYAAKHPMAEAYKVYKPMPYDRPMWDPSAVLYAVEPDAGYFNLSLKGRIRVDEQSNTWFTPEEEGMHSYLKADSLQAIAARKHIVDIITRKPYNYINK